jgi:broad specificity phosphatase PhoE
VRRFLCLVAALCLCGSAGAEPTIFVVRHAEKAQPAGGDAKDPELSAAGRVRAESLALTLKDAGITAIYASEFKRTQQTAAPIARTAGVEVTVVPAKETNTLVGRLKEHQGAALVVGHSNTIPEILKALGASVSFTIEEPDYDNLFVLPAGAPGQMIRLHLPAGQANGER